jgi:hypothetical protein
MSAYDVAMAQPPETTGGAPAASGGRLRSLWSRLVQAALHDQDSYLLLVVVLLGEYFALMVIPEERWSRLVSAPLVGLSLLLGLRTSGVRPRTLRIAQIAAGLAFLLVLIQVAVNAQYLVPVTYSVLGVLLLSTPPAVLRRVLRHETVTVETIAGAVSVYVLIGLVFAYFYLAIGANHPHAFADQSSPSGAKGGATFLYFSFVTLTTVGFGDVYPVGRLARALVVLEALLGQIFLVTTVARLVALYSAQGLRPPRPRR